MNFSKASKEQLYQIAVDEMANVHDRRKAAVELKERNIKSGCKCHYPNCVLDSSHAWGLIKICEPHYKMILQETMVYYRNATDFPYRKRKHYLKIAPLIPWSAYVKKAKQKEETV